MEIDHPELDPFENEFESNHENKILLPRPIRQEVDPPPGSVIKLIRCGCELM